MITGALILVLIALTQALVYSQGVMIAPPETLIGTQHAIVYQAPGSDDWPTYHRDMLRSGYDQAIPQFTSINRHWTSATLDGNVYAEPLIVGREVIVATEANSLYELNATNGQTLWHINLGTPVNGGALPCGDINPSGITGTPVIDVAGRTIFVVAFLQSPQLHHELFAVNLDNGNVEFHLTIDPSGANPLYQQQRAALALANGYVYVAYGGLDGDCGPYHGWLAATNASGGGSILSYQVPTGRAGAIWGGGDGPGVDQSGDLLVATGNSDATSTFDFGDAVLKLSPASTPPISLVDWFAPPNWAQLNQADLDLGSTEPRILSSNLLFQIGKEGVGYLLNATKLGGIGGQLYSAQVCTSGHGAYGGLAYAFPYLVVPCDNGVVTLKVTLGSNPSFTVVWRGPNFVAGPPIIAGNAVWDVDVGSGLIHAFSLSTGQTLFTDTLGSVPTHFNSLSAGDGQIFVSASRQVLAYLPLGAVTTTSSTTSTTTSLISTFLTTTSVTSVSTSTLGQVCTATSTTQTTSVIIQATTSSTTSTTITTTTGTSTFLTTTSSTRTSTTVTTTTVTACTQTSTSTSTSTTLTTFTRPPTSITLTASPSSVAVGSSVTLSGSISPNPGAIVVTISFSRDSGANWVMLMSVMTNILGRYSTSWAPPTPGNYLLEASWSGNSQLAPSQSSSAPLTVTGSPSPTSTVLLSAPATTPHGQTVTLYVTVFNSASSALNAKVTIEITGPNNYVLFDVIQVKVGANSGSTGYYDWAVPTQTGTYTIMLSLLPLTPSDVDIETIQVT